MVSQGNSHVVDLSLEMWNGMPTHPLLTPPVVLRYLSHEQSRDLGLGTPDDPFTYTMNFITMLDHMGTHVDAPVHTNPDAEPIDKVPLSRFAGPAICLDLRHVPDLGDIDVDDLEAAQDNADIQIDGQIVLLCTGFHARHWPRRAIVTSNPGITAAATHWLADRGSTVHGVEGPSTDKAGTSEFPNHRVCRDRGLIHYEWLVNLDALVGKGEFWFTGYPLKWLDGTGSPVRATATLDSWFLSVGRLSAGG